MVKTANLAESMFSQELVADLCFRCAPRISGKFIANSSLHQQLSVSRPSLNRNEIKVRSFCDMLPYWIQWNASQVLLSFRDIEPLHNQALSFSAHFRPIFNNVRTHDHLESTWFRLIKVLEKGRKFNAGYSVVEIYMAIVPMALN
jgi:hypothetical protein